MEDLTGAEKLDKILRAATAWHRGRHPQVECLHCCTDCETANPHIPQPAPVERKRKKVRRR